MNQHTLLIDRNLLAVIREPQPHIPPIISHSLPKVLVFGEHHLLKALPFYEVAHEANVKAHQDRLDQKEKKRQEGKLRQAPSGNRSTTTSIVHHLAKKKSSA